MPTREKKYQKENDAYVANLDSKMQEFYGVISDKFTDIRLTSGKRDKAGSARHSHHHTGNAIDFGRENYQVYNYLLNDKEGLELMVNYGYGIIDETDPEMLKKTGGTGPHFHIGPDSNFKKTPIDRLANFDKAEPVQSFYETNPLFDYKTIEYAKGDKSPDQSENILNHQEEYFHKFADYYRDPEMARNFVMDLYEGQKKDEIKGEKEEKNPARKDLREGTEKIGRINKAKEELARFTQPQQQQREQRRPVEDDPMHEIQIQRKMPELQSLFTIPEQFSK